MQNDVSLIIGKELFFMEEDNQTSKSKPRDMTTHNKRTPLR